MSWATGPMLGFDLETTSPDPGEARIVTACVVRCGVGLVTESRTWLADPGVEIPAEAAAIHGVTTERARAEGEDPRTVLAQLTLELATAAVDSVPIVIMNAPYDLTVLDRECRRHDAGPRPPVPADALVIDPKVIDKHLDRFRRGGRTLTDLCRTYGVALDGAHDAAYDAIAACRLAWRMGLNAGIGDLGLPELHAEQVAWHAEQASSLAAYFRRTPGKEAWADGVRTEWPMVPFPRWRDDIEAAWSS